MLLFVVVYDASSNLGTPSFTNQAKVRHIGKIRRKRQKAINKSVYSRLQPHAARRMTAHAYEVTVSTCIDKGTNHFWLQKLRGCRSAATVDTDHLPMCYKRFPMDTVCGCTHVRRTRSRSLRTRSRAASSNVCLSPVTKIIVWLILLGYWYSRLIRKGSEFILPKDMYSC